MKFKILIILVVLMSSNAFSSPIDDEMKECISTNQTTAGMTNCTYEAMEKWDVELNIVYQDLRSHLSEDARVTLLAAQRSWIKYKDLEIENIAEIYGSLEGTMYIPMRANAIMKITKKRALELKSYLTLVDK